MKRLLATTLLSLVCFVAHAEWVLVTTGADDNNYYSDPTTKRRTGNVVRIWELTEYKKSGVFEGKTYNSDRTYWQYDCSEGTRQYLQSNAFSGKMATGELVGSSTRSGAKFFVPPRTVANTMLEFACQ